MFKIAVKAFLFILLLSLSNRVQGSDVRRINIGYFEGGQYPEHSVLREEYYNQLEQLMPDSFQVVFVPEGYRTAEWKRDKCKEMAKELVSVPHLDMVVAVGPWVVEDLLEAGFKKPIIAMHQFDPKLEGLLDSTNKPITENLTVNYRPDKIFNDLAALTSLVKVKKLGLLYFPSADEKEIVYGYFKALGQRFGFDLVTGEGDDNYGTFAFFKAYANLSEKVDALYLPPMWGFDTHKLNEFLIQAARDHVPAFTAEGNMMIDHEAFATNDFYGVVFEARFSATKTIEIIEGAEPSELPVFYSGSNGLAINLQTAASCYIDLPDEITTGYYTLPKSLPENTPVYTLNESINRAVTQNPGFLSELEQLEADKSRTGIAKSGYYPQLDASGSLEYYDDAVTHNSGGRRDDNSILGQLSLTQNILSLSDLKKIRTAKDRTKLTQSKIESSRLDLEYLVSNIFINCLQAKEILAAYENYRNMIEHNLMLATAANQFNDGDTLDIIRLENELYNSIQQVVSAKGKYHTSLVDLNAVLNFPGDELFEINGEHIDENALLANETAFFDKINSDKKLKKITSQLLEKALAENPQFNSLDLSITLKKDLINETKAEWIPKVSLKGSLNYHDRLKDSPVFTENKSSWTVGGRATWPIFSGGEKISRKNMYNAEISGLEYRKDQLSLDIMNQVYNVSNKLAENSRNIILSYQAKEKSGQAAQLGVDHFGEGKLNVTDLINIQKNMIESELSYINNRYDYFRTMAQAVYLCGIPVSENYSNFTTEFHKMFNY